MHVTREQFKRGLVTFGSAGHHKTRAVNIVTSVFTVRRAESNRPRDAVTATERDSKTRVSHSLALSFNDSVDPTDRPGPSFVL